MKNKLSLFWKTWLTTTSALFITLFLFYFVFSIFTTHFIKESQKKQFLQTVTEITKTIRQNGIDEKQLIHYTMQNYAILIKENNTTVYPSENQSTVFFNSENIDINDQSNTVIPIEENNLEILESKKSIKHENSKYSVEIAHPLTINSRDIKKLLVSVLPYFIAIGFLVTFIISFLYANYFSKRVIHLDNSVLKMKHGEEIPPHIEKNGDELQRLENNLFSMYYELQNAYKQLEIEIENVRHLEEDRQLFMRGATHELKTPIMAMDAQLLNFLDSLDESSDAYNTVLSCYTRLQVMKRLVNEMLDLSKTELIVYHGFTDVSSVTEEICDMYEYMSDDKHLKIKKNLAYGSKIQLHSKSFKKIISNLIGNAIKYSPTYSDITIKSTETSWEIVNTYNYMKSLDPNQLSEPFITFEKHIEEKNDSEQSHGLGLYIVTNILKQSNITYVCSAENNRFLFQFFWN